MQVYKLFLKILRAQKAQVLIYVCIFLAIMGLMNSQNNSTDASAFISQKLEIAVCDRDHSEASKVFCDYLFQGNKKVTPPSFKKEVLQDELFFRTLDAAVIIPAGFEKALSEGNFEGLIEVYSMPGLMTSDLTIRRVNTYLNTAKSYASQGHSLKESLQFASENAKVRGEVKYLKKTAAEGNSKRYTFFAYLAYVIVCICFVAGLNILRILNIRRLENRIMCSSYPFSRRNLEILLGLITLGAIILIAFGIFAFVLIGDSLVNMNGLLLLINTLGYLAMSLSLTYFLGQLIEKETLISAAANIVGLGFSFLGGVFVPMAYLGEGVLKIAHFLPSYWYVKGVDFANTYSTGSLLPLMRYIGVELIFGFVFFLAGATALRLKEK